MLDAARAALDVARHAARLPLQMKAQRQRVEMAEHLQRKLAHRALGHFRKEDLAQLAEKRSGEPHERIGDHQQPDAAEQHDGRRMLDAPERGQVLHRSEVVDDVLHHDRHAQVRDFRADQAAERQHDAPLVGREVRHERQDRLPVVARLSRYGRGFGRGGIAAHEGR